MARFSITALFKAEDGFSRIAARIESRTQRLMRAASQAASSTTRALNAASKHTDRFTSGLASMGKTAAVTGATALTAGLVTAIKRGADFEQAIANVAAVSGAAGVELDALQKRAIELGSTTKFSGTEVAGAMESMMKAGFGTQDALKGVGALLSAAAADGGELADISGGLMSTLKGFGAGSDQLQYFADAMAKAGDSTAASIGSLSESMAKFGPVARTLNVSASSSIAQLALLEDAGMDASSAGTQLSAVYSKLASPLGTTKKELKALGIQVADAHGNMRPPDELFAAILKATDAIEGNVGKTSAFVNLVGLESKTAMLNLAAAAKSGRLGSLTKDLEQAAGYADQIAAKRMDTFWGDLKLLGGAVDGIVNSLYSMQGGALRGVIQGISGWINANKQLIATRINDFINQTIAFVREAIPVVREFGAGFLQGVRDVLPAFTWLGGAILSVTGWISQFFGDEDTSRARNFGRVVGWVASAIVGVSVATRVATGLKWAYRAAVIAVKGALWLLKGMYATTKTAVDLFTRSTRASGDALTKGTSRISSATTKMGKFQEAAGAATLALGAWALAWEANEELAGHTQGLGAWGIAKGMWNQGTWNPMDVVDKHQNELARADKAKRDREAGAARAPGRSGGDVQGGVDGMLNSIESKLGEMTAGGTTDMAALESLKSSLAAASAAVPNLSMAPGAAEGATAAQERIDALLESIDGLAAAAQSGPLQTPLAQPALPAPLPSGAAQPKPQSAVVQPESVQAMARVFGAEVRRALKETPLNVSVDGAAPVSGGKAPAGARPRVNVSDSGAP
jgi:TP901 family phage tail tape measure protein